MTAPDLTTYRAIHLALRGGADVLARTAATIQPGNLPRVAALRRYWDGYAAEVHTHHTIEDEIFFPALVARVPIARALIDQTDEEHGQLDAISGRCDAAVAALVRGERTDDLAVCFAELADLMGRHLDLEDDDLIPLFERHFAGEDYDALTSEAEKRLRLSEALFTVPFVSHFLSADLREQVLGSAPLPFRIVHRLTRRRHTKLVEVLVGAAGAPAAVPVAA